MTGLKDIINFLLPVPPAILIMKNEFPNCPEIFEHISKNPPNPRILGRLFSRLCAISGFSWIVWGINTIVFSLVAGIFLFNWGNNIDMTCPHYFGVLSCRNLIAIFAACLFFGQLIFYIATTISLQLSDRCYEHIDSAQSMNKKAKSK